MAIYREVFSQPVENTATITKKTDAPTAWGGAYRFRMSFANSQHYGPFNSLTISNTSSEDANIHWNINYATTGNEITRFNAGATVTLNVDDGKKFYYFDVVNQNATTDIGANEILGSARVIKQEAE